MFGKPDFNIRDIQVQIGILRFPGALEPVQDSPADRVPVGVLPAGKREIAATQIEEQEIALTRPCDVPNTPMEEEKTDD